MNAERARALAPDHSLPILGDDSTESAGVGTRMRTGPALVGLLLGSLLMLVLLVLVLASQGLAVLALVGVL